MSEASKKEDAWQAKATEAAIAEARMIVRGDQRLMGAPVGKLTDIEWGWIVCAAIFAWIEVRVEQAIAEGLDQEQSVCSSGMTPSPSDVAVVRSILPGLADAAGIDWALPLSAWSKNDMTNFLMLAWQLISKAEIARDQGAGKIIRPASWDKEGEPLPFVP